jgi:hypothetical protein
VNRNAPSAACLGLLLLFAAIPARSGDDPFTFPSNNGLTGLWETPTARILPENRYRIGVNQVKPYRAYFGTVGLYKGLEVNGRITTVLDVPGFDNNSSYGDFKDKAVDLKYQFISEGKYAPAVALVVMDPHGTRLYSTQAIVASKQIYPFDFTIGLGNGRLGKKPLSGGDGEFGLELFTQPRKWWRESQLFGGIQFAPSDRYALALEYSPIRYDRQTVDPAQGKYFTRPVKSRINAGLRWKPTRWSEVDVSFQRGNQVGAGFSLAFDIGKPLVPIYDAPYREREEVRLRTTSERIAVALSGSGFSEIGVENSGGVLWIEAQNDKYYFNTRAVEVLLETVSPLLPEDASYVRIRIKENGIPLLEYSAAADDLRIAAPGEIPRPPAVRISGFRTDVAESERGETVSRRRFVAGLKPSLETFLNDPSGFFKYRLGLAGTVKAFPWTGGMLLVGLEGYPVNTVSTSNTPPPNPVRSDLPEYKKEKAAIGRLLYDQIVKTERSIHARIAAGWLEIEYAGADAEAAIPLLDGRIFAGIGGSLVWKRDPHDILRLLDSGSYHTTFLNTRINLPEWNTSLDIKAGRFLAGDRGARFTLSKFINGVVLSGWYGLTDTTVFNDSINRGYHDKGIAVDIPLRLFEGRDTRTSYRYALTPWTRDAGQDVDHYRNLFDFIGRNTPLHIDKDLQSGYRDKR